MSASIVTPTSGPMAVHLIADADGQNDNLRRSFRTRPAGQLWERIAEASGETAPVLYFAKIKRDGLWGPARFRSGDDALALLIDEVRDEPYPAIIASADRIVWANRHAQNSGLRVGRSI